MSQQSQSTQQPSSSGPDLQSGIPITGRGLAGQPLLQPTQPGKPGLPQRPSAVTHPSPIKPDLPEQSEPKPEEPSGPRPNLPKPGELEPGKPQIEPGSQTGYEQAIPREKMEEPTQQTKGTKIFFQGEEPIHEPMPDAYQVLDEKEVKKRLEKAGESGEQIFAEPVTPGEVTSDTAGIKAAESAQDVAPPMK